MRGTRRPQGDDPHGGGPLAQIAEPITLSHDVSKLVECLLKVAPAEHLRVVYEAGPTGFGLCRGLIAKGIRCVVIAPNRVPLMPGPRMKTDKRDAKALAHPLRMGALSPIALPERELEALRDLARAREDALMQRLRARQQLAGYFLRQGARFDGKTRWTEKYVEWARSVSFASEARIPARTSTSSSSCAWTSRSNPSART